MPKTDKELAEEIYGKRLIERPFYIGCVCHSPEHTVSFNFDEDYQEVFINVFLNQWRGFFKRLWVGVKYIFGYRCLYGDFDCTSMDTHTTIELRDKLDDFIDKVLIKEFDKKEEEKKKKWEN